MAHKRGVERDITQVFLTELSRHGSIRKACNVAGVSRSWVRNQQLNDEEFGTAYQDALDDSVDRLEEQANMQARCGDEKLLRYLLDVKRYKKTSETDIRDITPNVIVNIGT